ncbi:glycosyltransferase family 4 protein [Actinoplanes sp. NPDC026619]|uniref:glycosyltransferase family 4 protein n=1 Tax=Actinoplanes sp. NPDC026619 TaxID=3155798 RepID=UPI0033CC0FA8
MRIAVFSLGPLFPAAVHGGSQRTLEAVVRHLADGGDEVSVYCTRRDDNEAAFALAPSAVVHPVLQFRQTYPEPYEAAPYQLAAIVETLAEAAAGNDVFYVHDGELLYHFIYDAVPTVVSFQDFVYPTTLAGALSFRRDHLVLSSRYVRDCVEQTFDRFRPLPAERISVAPNGFDLTALRPVDASALRRELGLAPDALPILYPHRPDPRKGITESLDALLPVLDKLPDEQANRVRLLVPVWMDAELDSPGAREYRGSYADVLRRAADAGRPGLVHLHPWVDSGRMHEYYSLGVLTLCVGSFVEAFGNASVESQLCGTPAIVSRVGAQRSVLPEDLVAKVDHGDAARTGELILAALSGAELYPYEALREYVAAEYGFTEMARGYAEAIRGTRPQPALPALDLAPEADSVRVPAWCATLSSGYYNDYSYGYAADQRLVEVAARCRGGALPVSGLADLAGPDDISAWLHAGHLIGGRR